MEQALHDLQGTGGRELLRHIDGVVGSLMDLIELDEGWESAFEAAAGAGMAAIVVDGRRSARQALDTLRAEGAPARCSHRGSGPTRPTTSRSFPLEAARSGCAATCGPATRRHDRLVLDTLVGRAVRVDGWEEAIDPLARTRHDLVVVTPEGDRFAATGWRVLSQANVVTAAAVEEAKRRAGEDAIVANAAGPT